MLDIDFNLCVDRWKYGVFTQSHIGPHLLLRLWCIQALNRKSDTFKIPIFTKKSLSWSPFIQLNITLMMAEASERKRKKTRMLRWIFAGFQT